MGARRARVAAGPGIFWHYTLRSLAGNRVRTAVTVAGIALATGLLTAVLASVTSLHAALLDSTRAHEGVWQIQMRDVEPDDLERLRAEAREHLDRLALQRDLGAAAFAQEDAERLGTYLSLVSLPSEQGSTQRRAGDGAFAVVNGPHLREGRLPEAAGEVALPSALRGAELSQGASPLPGDPAGVSCEGPVELGSTVTLRVGRRVGTSPEGSFELGARDSTWLSEDGDGALEEALADVEERPLVVVGFVAQDYERPGLVAYVSYDEPAPACGELVEASFSTTGYADAGQIRELAERALGDGGGYATNDVLLMEQGLDGTRSIASTVTRMAAVVLLVVAAAAVSLISNAFVISVSERTRQFGLLSSLGASARQLRRTVLLEAGVLGALGIPLGVALGLVGAAVAFSLTSEGWAVLVGGETAVGLVVEPWAIAASVALSCAALVASAAVPALRAGRVSAVDAIRQTRDVRLDRGLGRLCGRRAGAMGGLSQDRTRPRGLAARVAGMPGFLARRARVAGASRARVAVASLAVSVTLLVTAGVLDGYLARMTGSLDYYGVSFDCEVTAADAAGAPIGSSLPDAQALLARAAALDGVDEAALLGYGYALVRMDARLADDEVSEAWTQSSGGDVPVLDPNGWAYAHLYLADDATWRELARELGLAGDAGDPNALSCVVFNALALDRGGRYEDATPFEEAAGAEVELVGLADDGGGQQVLTVWDGVRYESLLVDPDTGAETHGDLADAVAASARVPVAAFARDLGERFPFGTRALSGNIPVVVMPASGAWGHEGARAALRSANGIWYSWYLGLAGDAGGTEADRVVEELCALVEASGSMQLLSSENLLEMQGSQRAATYTVQVFLYCFTAIMAFIAVANVFNTISSGMMLRTREFAALRSAGMGARALRRMVLLECLGHALRGLLLGGALALAVDAALFGAMSASYADLCFAVPWGHLLAACAVVCAVLAASCAYALRKTHAMNLVEALRADAL